MTTRPHPMRCSEMGPGGAGEGGRPGWGWQERLPRLSAGSGGSGRPAGWGPDRPDPLQCTCTGRRRGQPVAGPCQPSGLGSMRPSLRRCASPHQGGRGEGSSREGWAPSSSPDLGGASLLRGTPQPRPSLPTAQAGRMGTRLRPQLFRPQLGGHCHGGAEIPHCVQHQPAQHQGAGPPHRPQHSGAGPWEGQGEQPAVPTGAWPRVRGSLRGSRDRALVWTC